MMNISIVHNNRNIFGILFFAVSLLLVSCEDHIVDLPAEESDIIGFGIRQDRSEVVGNGGKTDKAAGNFMLRSADSTDSLYMSAVVTDGIMSESDARGVHTCAAPVTNDNFAPNGFHVWAFWKTGSTLNPLYMNETVKDNGSNIWSSERVHYWPGADHTLRFFAYSPESSSISVPENENNPDNATLKYTVSDNVTSQYDIVVATTAEIPGDNNATVPLTFKHICTAVRFVVGSQMQPGRIESVALKGVYNSGTYNMAASSWSLSDTKSNFSQTINKVVDGTETAGTEITPADRTFMMLPQTLPSGATVEVVFANEANVSRTLTTSIAGSEWSMGKTVTYKLSVSPEYELEFVTEAPTLDAHYVITPVKIKAKNLLGGNYTLVSSEPQICRLREELIGPEKLNYWPKESAAGGDFARKESITSSVETDEVTYYAFLMENISESEKDIHLYLKYKNKTVDTLTIRQKCPIWRNDIGWENIEEYGKRPYGFAWNRKVKYESKGSLSNIMLGFLRFFGSFSNNTAVEWNGFIIITGCTIDYSKVQALTNVFSDTDGLSNTLNFKENSASDLFSFENTLLEYCNKKAETGDNISAVDFAALSCIRKNACNVEKKEEGSSIVYYPSFTADDILWYLPAKNQFSGNVGLNGQYWTSTGIDDNVTAWSWSNNHLRTPRVEEHNVRAVRKRP